MAKIPEIMIEPCVRMALLEDLGRGGDLTSDLVVESNSKATVVLEAREDGVVAGLDFARIAFSLIDPSIVFKNEIEDGHLLVPGKVIARIEGGARGILTAERVALNFLGHLSGIASATADIANAISHTKAKISCTRKTTPGLRFAEKYAVRMGGGVNHRFGLDDAILIKDNHIAIAGGVGPALSRAKQKAGHLVKIEIEVDTIKQLEEALYYRPDAVLLDNMSPQILREAVKIINGCTVAEASGKITAFSAPEIAETGVDLISAGWLTHSAKVLDIGLDFIE